MGFIWLIRRKYYTKYEFRHFFIKKNQFYIYYFKVHSNIYKRTRSDEFKTELIKNFSNDILPLFE